jgi:hypothetical protein
MPGKTLLSGTRFAAAALAIGLALCCPYRLSNVQQNPFGQLGEALKQKAAEKTVSALLNNDLPLRLDANAVYPTAPAPPGGPFAPQPLSLTVADLDRPLPPGDYTLNVLAFCTEYSVHRPGAGVAYRLGPLQGKAASAIGDLLWRGTLEKNVQPQQLQAVSWAIQSGLHYDQVPRTYQSVIDNVIPEHRSQLNGDFIQSLEDTYNSLAKGTRLPPLQQMLAGMGKSGQLALSADRQRQALLRQNTSDQIKEKTLFAGQESGVYTPVRAEQGPWTERIPGVAYVRFLIVGGNLARNNIMQIRILSASGQRVGAQRSHVMYASFVATPAASASMALGSQAGGNAARNDPGKLDCWYDRLRGRPGRAVPDSRARRSGMRFSLRRACSEPAGEGGGHTRRYPDFAEGRGPNRYERRDRDGQELQSRTRVLGQHANDSRRRNESPNR